MVLVVKSLNGRALPKPRFFYDETDTFYSARQRDSRLGKALNRLHNSIVLGDRNTEIRVRKVIEDTFLREAENIDYDVSVITYDPIERYSTGKIESVEVTKSYSKNHATK